MYRLIVGLIGLTVRSGRPKDLEIIILRHGLEPEPGSTTSALDDRAGEVGVAAQVGRHGSVGLRPVRAEQNAGLHFEGTGETAWGTKWVFVACRTEDVHGRIILNVKWVPQPGSEAGVAVESFEDLAPLCPGAQGVIYDTALRGVHHQKLLRDLGWLSVNKVAAKVADTKGKPRRNKGKRVEKSTHVEDRTITDTAGNEQSSRCLHRGAPSG